MAAAGGPYGGYPTEDQMQDWNSATAGQLEGDLQRGTASTEMLDELVAREVQANKQRERIFKVALTVAIAMLAVDGLVIILLGWHVCGFSLPPTTAVAFISAASIQSFLLIGILARGLYAKETWRSEN